MAMRSPSSSLHTWVPKNLGAWVKKQAAADGVTVAAWLRRLVMAAREKTGGDK